MRGLVIASVLVVFHLAPANASAECRLSPKAAQSEIDKTGAKTALESWFSDWQGKWNPLMECIATGDQAWLHIAEELATYSDAGSSEDLSLYLGKALANNAEGVLRLKPSDAYSSMCSFLDNDPPSNMDAIQLDTWYLKDLNARLTGLKKVHSSDLTTAVARCESGINEEISALNEDIASHTGQKAPQ